MTSHDIHLYALAALSSGLKVGGAGRSSEPSEFLAFLAALALLICSSRSSPSFTRFFSAVATIGSLTFFSYGGGRGRGRGGEGRGGEGRRQFSSHCAVPACSRTSCSAASTALEYMPMAASRCPFSSSTHACSSWYSNCRNTP